MAPKSTEKKSKTIGISLNKQTADALEERAKSMHLSTSNYCKIILAQWLDSGNKLKLQEEA